MRSLLNLRAELTRASHRLHAAGWVANHDGNLSARLGAGRFLVTPTAVSKALVREDGLLVVDGDGKLVEGRRRPFSELDLHLACYRARPDAAVVCHAHPPAATAFGVAGCPLEPLPLPEAVVSLGAVPTVPLAPPRSPEGVQGVERAAATADAFLVEGNGVFTLGDGVEQALLRMELVEHVAQVLLFARQLGGARALPGPLVASLLAARAKAGLGSTTPAQRKSA
ncbi:MAG: class II aldolase/adducin family protein [Deltaproteobacteria bacterium]